MTGQIHLVGAPDRERLEAFCSEHWGSPLMISRRVPHRAQRLPELIAASDDRWVDRVAYHCDGDQCGVVSLDGFWENQGVGPDFLQAVERTARNRDVGGCGS